MKAIRLHEFGNPEVFRLEKVLTPRPGLPGFVYIHSIVSPEPIYLNPDSTLSTAVYGITRLTQPWLLHPTEVLDGAVCGSFFSGDFYRWFTWPLTNSIVLHMCRRHGIDFNFLGCIMVRTMWEEQRQKELMANRAALMATTLGAAGAIVTPTLRGQRMLDTMAVVRACEEAGLEAQRLLIAGYGFNQFSFFVYFVSKHKYGDASQRNHFMAILFP